MSSTTARLRTRLALVVLSTAFVILTTALPASACCSGPDPDDTSGRLDMSAASGFKDAPGAPLDLSIETFGRWGDRVLARSGPGRVFVYFDTTGDLVSDYVGKVKLAHGRLVMVITGPGFRSQPLEVRRPNRSKAKVTVAFYFRTEFTAVGACSGGCADETPDVPGWFGPI